MLMGMMVIFILLPAALFVGVAVSTENGEACAVDDQAEHRNEDRLIESDGHGRQETRDTLPGHGQSD